MKPQRLLIQIVLRTFNKDRLNMEWYFPDGLWQFESDPRYCISRDMLLSRADAARDGLTTLMHIMHREDPTQKQNDNDFIACVNELILYGRQFFNALLPVDDEAAQRVTKILRTRETNYRLHVVLLCEELSIPWGLIFPLPDKIECSDRKEAESILTHFWAIKYSPIISKHMTQNSKILSKSTVLTYTNPHVKEYIKLNRHIEENVSWKYSQELPNKATSDFNEFKFFLEQIFRSQSDETIVNLVTHSTADGIAISNQKILTNNQFSSQIADVLDSIPAPDKLTPPPSIVRKIPFTFWILNMCGSATVGEKVGITSKLEQNGFQYFMATETIIPTAIGPRISLEFIYWFKINGLNILETIDKLIENFGPWMLNYRVFCQPEMKSTDNLGSLKTIVPVIK